MNSNAKYPHYNNSQEKKKHKQNRKPVVESEFAKHDLMPTMNSTLTSLSTCVSSE